MSRNSHQNPSVKKRESARGTEYYIRYKYWSIEIEDGLPSKIRRTKYHPLGLKSEVTLAQAKKTAAKIMEKVNGQSTLASNVPLHEFVEVYKAEHYRGLKETTQRSYSAMLKRYIVPALGDSKLCEVDTFAVTRLLGSMERAQVARNTRCMVKIIVGDVFKWARKWGYVARDAENPAKDAEVGRTRGNEVEQWTPTMEEAERIIAACSEQTGILLWIIIWTGMRISEVCGLRWKNIDLDTGVIYVKERRCGRVVDDPKSNLGTRTLPLGSFAARLAPLKGEPEELLIVKLGHPTENRFYKIVREAMREVGLYHAGNMFHAFRRLHSRLIADCLKGATSLFDLKRQLGHADISTTQLYVGDNLSARKQALNEAQDKVIEIRRKA